MPGGSLTCIPGDLPLVLVAPHGGRRDAARDPWQRGGLRTNDLHTADLTAALARATGAAAIVNDAHDRNRVDLNRIDETAERLPAFLDAIHEAIARAVGRHGRATLLTVHGWNTTAPAVDVGLGCRPGRAAANDPPGPAVNPIFAARAVPAFAAACARRGVSVSVGRRYPARAPQNLIQLFTGRWRNDERAAVERVVRFGPDCDAMQLELGIPLRWPGQWRDAFVAALCEATPTLLDPAGAPPAAPHDEPPARVDWTSRRLDFVSAGGCGIAALDARGGRLLLVGLHQGLDLFTHERVGGDDTNAVGALSIRPAPDGAALGYRGPVSRFPDTEPFLDLEAGLAGADVEAADVVLAFRPAHRRGEPCPFGDVVGSVRIAGRVVDIDGPGVLCGDDVPIASAWFDLGGGQRVAVDEGGESAVLCDRGRHRRLRCHLTGTETGTSIDIVDAGATRRVDFDCAHSIPIVRGRSRPATSLALATYRRGGRLVGWGQHTAPVVG